MLRRLLHALPVLAVAAAFLRPPPAHAHTQMFTVSVGRNGFEQQVDFVLEVEAGHPVTLTFTYADGDLAGDNPHDLRIKGAGLDLPIVHISREQPTASITFTPKKSGRLRVLCIVPCIGMENLAGGMLKVVKARPRGAAATLALSLKPRDDAALVARATLLGPDGQPLADAPVLFTQHTSLGGDLLLGTPKTMEDGSAVVKIPTVGGEVLSITAAFEGGNGLAYTETTASLTAPGAVMEHRPGSLASPSAPPALALILLVVLGGVWAAYGFVAYQVIRIRSG